MKLAPKGKDWGRVLVILAVGIALIEVARNQLWDHEIEGYILLVALVFGYTGGRMQDSVLADGTIDKLTDKAVLLLGAVPWGRRAYDALVTPKSEGGPGAKQAVIVARTDVPPPPELTKEQ